MNQCNKCEIVTTYKASDGTIFNTEKECSEYMAKPNLYFISEEYHTHNSLLSYAYLDYKEATAEAKRLNKRSDFYFYYVKTVVLELPPKQTIHSAVTNTLGIVQTTWNHIKDFLNKK